MGRGLFFYRMNPILKYRWLVGLLLENRQGLTLSEIADRWEMRDLDGRPFCRRSFQRWREEAEEIFSIRIECNSSYRYYIAHGDVENDRLSAWLMHSLSISNLANDLRDMRESVLFEDAPKGEEYLGIILEAMKSCRQLSMIYHNFNRVAPNEPALVNPLCVKMRDHRWYMVAEYTKYPGQPRVLALDRVVGLTMEATRFKKLKGFNASEFFAESYGVMAMPDMEAKKVVLKFDSHEAKYIRSLPIHESQQETVCDGYSLFTYRLKLTEDFLIAMLPHAFHGEVIEPLELREEMCRRAKKILERNKSLTP